MYVADELFNKSPHLRLEVLPVELLVLLLHVLPATCRSRDQRQKQTPEVFAGLRELSGQGCILLLIGSRLTVNQVIR